MTHLVLWKPNSGNSLGPHRGRLRLHLIRVYQADQRSHCGTCREVLHSLGRITEHYNCVTKDQLQQELGLCVHKGWARRLLDRVQSCVHSSAGPDAQYDADPGACAMREYLTEHPDTHVARGISIGD